MRGLNPLLYDAIIEWGSQLSGQYPIFEVANSRDNLKNNEEEVLANLLLEFPSSYRQAYEAYIDFFNNEFIYLTYQKLEIINVLMLGTGSGGDVFGFIHAIERVFKGKTLNIYSVEGNELALRSQVNIYKEFFNCQTTNNKIEIIPIHYQVEHSLEELQEVLKKVCYQVLNIEAFDVIQVYKFMNEVNVRHKIRFFDLYRFINKNLGANRISMILEQANPTSKHICDRTVSARALIEFTTFCQQFYKRHQLHALTPSPCVARCLSGLNINQCHQCTTCFEEVNCYTYSYDLEEFEVIPTYIFSMKIVSGDLGKKVVDAMQDETIGYRTKSEIGQYQVQYCTLNATVKPETYGNAFKLTEN